MPERVVDVLELIEIEIKHGEPLPALDLGQRLVQPLAQQDAVGKIGQRVVTRHMRDFHLRLAPLGDILVGRHPAAARHRLAHHGDSPAVVQFDKLGHLRAGFDRR